MNEFFAYLNAQPWANLAFLAMGVLCLVIYWKVKRLVKLLVLAFLLFAVFAAGHLYGVI